MSVPFSRNGTRYIAIPRRRFWGGVVALAVLASCALGYIGTLKDDLAAADDALLKAVTDRTLAEQRVRDKDTELDRARGYYDAQVKQTVNAWASAAILLQSSEWHARQSGSWKRRAELGWREIGNLKERIERVEKSWGNQVDARSAE